MNLTVPKFGKWIATFAAALTVLVALPAAMASAHAILNSSTPAPSSVLPESPPAIELNFNETVEASFGSIHLYDANEKRVEIGKAVRNSAIPSQVTAPLPQLPNGTYVVVWRVVSADGHPVSGAFPFEIGTTSSGKANDLLTAVLNKDGSKSSLGIPLGMARGVLFVGLIMFIGTIVLLWGNSLLGSMAAQALMLCGVYATALGTIFMLLLQGAYDTGAGWGKVGDITLLHDVAVTRAGIAELVRLGICVLWVLLIVLASKGKSRNPLWQNVAFLSIALALVTCSVSGHPSTASMAAVWVGLDVLHLTSISVWVGGLFAMATVRRFIEPAEDVEVANRFSAMATFALPVALLTGVVQGLHILNGVGKLTTNPYGRLLLAKFVVLGMMGILGARARNKLNRDGAPSILRTIRLESTLALVAIGFTAVLVATSPVTSSSPNTFNATLVEANIVANITVAPPRVGPSEVHVILSPPGGTLTPVVKVAVRMTLPERNVPAVPVIMTEIGPNHWTGIVQIPYTGKWTLEALVNPDENSTLRYATDVKVGK